MDNRTPAQKRAKELVLRFASAAVLIPVALAMVWYGGWWLATGCAVFAAIMAWEWAQISAYAYGHVLAVFAAALCLTFPVEQLWLTALVLVAGMCFGLITMPGKFPQRGTAACGLLYVGGMVAGLYFLREGPWDGRQAALYFMPLVWLSDAAAYFTGRGIGGPRLWPSESPNKTWAGAIGAVIFCGIAGLAMADVEQASFPVWLAAGLLTSVVAQAGDLFESGLKRRFKVKDTGAILPGHGGVLDRVDGLGAVCVFAALSLYLISGLAAALGL